MELAGVSYGYSGESRMEEEANCISDVAAPSGRKGIILPTYGSDSDILDNLRNIAHHKCSDWADVMFKQPKADRKFERSI